MEPTLSKYFGSDHINPDEVPSSAKFQKLGEAFLKQMKEFVSKYPDDSALKDALKPFMAEHKKYKVGPAEMKKAGPIWLKFIENHAGLTSEQKGAWLTFFDKLIHLAEQV
ncbi:unnamed protein product [Soboliphyme baturini]|uniref:GLOBIN domain-containing protein n=1 Tax=Soboliphyme baturini TaxID=241478 RepID=A0A183IBN1_9BILA|nr:unnamed protein product [Soboliphyme baturini]